MSHLVKGERARLRVRWREGEGAVRPFFCAAPAMWRWIQSLKTHHGIASAWLQRKHMGRWFTSTAYELQLMLFNLRAVPPLAHSLIFTPPSLILPPHFILSRSVHVALLAWLFLVQYYILVLSGLSQQICITCKLQKANNTNSIIFLLFYFCLSSCLELRSRKKLIRCILNLHKCNDLHNKIFFSSNKAVQIQYEANHIDNRY